MSYCLVLAIVITMIKPIYLKCSKHTFTFLIATPEGSKGYLYAENGPIVEKKWADSVPHVRNLIFKKTFLPFNLSLLRRCKVFHVNAAKAKRCNSAVWVLWVCDFLSHVWQGHATLLPISAIVSIYLQLLHRSRTLGTF